MDLLACRGGSLAPPERHLAGRGVAVPESLFGRTCPLLLHHDHTARHLIPRLFWWAHLLQFQQGDRNEVEGRWPDNDNIVAAYASKVVSVMILLWLRKADASHRVVIVLKLFLIHRVRDDVNVCASVYVVEVSEESRQLPESAAALILSFHSCSVLTSLARYLVMGKRSEFGDTRHSGRSEITQNTENQVERPGARPSLFEPSAKMDFLEFAEQVDQSRRKTQNKTYSSRDSHVVTHRSTNLPFNCLCMAERTGCPVFS
ncbi:hypothetical protein KCU62_g500, partial [Aureobasidium sp. EXF-3399]